MQSGLAAYSLSSFLFLALTLTLILRWPGRLGGPALVAATSLTALWAGVLAYDVSVGGQISIYALILEQIKNLFWIFYFTRLVLSIDPGKRYRSSPMRWVIWVAFIVPILQLVGLFFQLFNSVPLSEWVFNDSVLLLNVIQSILPLVFIEHIYRNAPADSRWGLKFLCLGAALFNIYDFYLYSYILLSQDLDPGLWHARGLVYSLAVPLIAIAVKRDPKLETEAYVSRNVVFYTSALFLSGIYLIGLSLGSYYVKSFGGDWGEVAQVAFLFLGLTVLVALGASGQIRARLRVFIDKHFLNYKYDYREEWLRLMRQLSVETQDRSQLAQGALLAMAEIVDCHGGALWLRDQNNHFRQVSTSSLSGLENIIEKPDSSLVQFLETWQWVINLEEYHTDKSLYQDLVLPEWLSQHGGVWIIVPLMLQTRLFGFIVLSQPRAPRVIDWEDIDILKTAGRQIAIHLAQGQSAKELAEARQFEAFNRLSAYVVHDLKNLVSQLALLVRNAEKHKSNPVFVDDMITTVENSVDRMNKLLAQLRADKDKAAGNGQKIVNLAQVLAKVIKDKANGKPVPTLKAPEKEIIIEADGARLVSVIGHLVQNAQDATDDKGFVRIRLSQNDSDALIDIEDNGSGMDEDFIRDRLFKPFDSTKGLTGMGIGAHDARAFIESLAGTVQVQSAKGVGTTISLKIPVLVPPKGESLLTGG